VTGFTESVVEEAALAWLRALEYSVLHGPDNAPGEPAAERKDYGQVLLEDRLRRALARLNPRLPAEALDDTFRKIVRVEGPTPEARNRAFHRMLVDGVTVEYRRPDGSIAGAQVRVVDFAQPDANDWLAVNQFTVSEGKHTRRPDVVLFVNGLPLALMELKNAADEKRRPRRCWNRRKSSRRSGLSRSGVSSEFGFFFAIANTACACRRWP
jgi:type I restriction enzyme R subunit